MRRCIISLLLSSISFFACAQADSLRKQFTNRNDSLRTDAMLQLAKLYFVQFNSGDSLIKYARQALAVAERTKNPTQLYTAKRYISMGYVTNSDTINTLPALNAALQQAETCKNFMFIADVYHGYAAYYGNCGENDSALSYFIREVESAQQANYYSAMAVGYSSIALIYRSKKQYDRMLYYHRKALGILEKMETTNIGNIIQVYTTSSQGYFYVAENTHDSVLLDSAKVLADSVLAMAIRYNRLAPRASAYLVYAYHAYYNKKFENAERYALEALEFRNYSDVRGQFSTYKVIAASNAHLKNSQRALLYLDSMRYSAAFTELYYRWQYAESEWEVYRALGNYEAALRAHEVLLATKDSLDNLEATELINEIEQKFHKEENEREIQRLAAGQEISSLNNKLLTAGIVAATLFAIIILLFARQRNLKNEQNRLLTEQRLNRARMDPHFLFNTFTALQGMVLKEKDPVKVAGYLSEYSVIMRQTLESTFAELTSVEEEVSYLEKYLSLQQMRLPGKFDFEITVDDKIDPMETMVPAMIIQPFAENSIEHAFPNLPHHGMLSVNFTQENMELKITIKDNGQGYSFNKTDKAYPSRATGIIKDRLMLLNKKYSSNARYALDSAATGVTVTIYLPQLK